MNRIICCFFSLFIAMSISYAQSSPPVTLLKNVSQAVINDLDKHRATYRLDHKKLTQMIQKHLIPHVALNTLSQSVLGRHYWAQASAKQRREFIDLFLKTVINVYAHALTSYQKQQIKFLPIRGYRPDQNSAQVQCLLQPHDGRLPIRVTYQLIKQQGQWKILDFSVDGVSLIRNYRAQFAPSLSQGGMTTLLQRMKARSKQ